MTATALIAAAGRGERITSETGDRTPKQYLSLGGVPVLRLTLERFLAHEAIARIIVAINPSHRDQFAAAAQGLGERVSWVAGGAERQSSVRAGLRGLRVANPRTVLIHDGVRPFVSRGLIDRVLKELRQRPAVIPVLPAHDAVKRIENGMVKDTVDRRGLVLAQTPQGFHFEGILEAHSRAAVDKAEGFVDDAALACWAGMPVHLTEGDPDNAKITTSGDIKRAERRITMERLAALGDVRMGHGFDAHAFAAGGDHVRLCGVDVPSVRSLSGHSDADVGLHALTDAVLGAIGAGDIGSHFPPGDPRWRGASSDRFLAAAAGMVRELGGIVAHVDVTLICEEPKVGPHRLAMRASVAAILGIERARVSVKATTTEGLGFTGRGEGIAAQATATVRLPV